MYFCFGYIDFRSCTEFPRESVVATRGPAIHILCTSVEMGTDGRRGSKAEKGGGGGQLGLSNCAPRFYWAYQSRYFWCSSGLVSCGLVFLSFSHSFRAQGVKPCSRANSFTIHPYSSVRRRYHGILYPPPPLCKQGANSNAIRRYCLGIWLWKSRDRAVGRGGTSKRLCRII